MEREHSNSFQYMKSCLKEDVNYCVSPAIGQFLFAANTWVMYLKKHSNV